VFEIYSLNYFKVHSTLLLTLCTLLCNRSQNLLFYLFETLSIKNNVNKTKWLCRLLNVPWEQNCSMLKTASYNSSIVKPHKINNHVECRTIWINEILHRIQYLRTNELTGFKEIL
jgi:hypothetical protein